METIFSISLLYLSGSLLEISASILFLQASLWIPVLPLLAASQPLQPGVSPRLDSETSSILMYILLGITSRALGWGLGEPSSSSNQEPRIHLNTSSWDGFPWNAFHSSKLLLFPSLFLGPPVKTACLECTFVCEYVRLSWLFPKTCKHSVPQRVSSLSFPTDCGLGKQKRSLSSGKGLRNLLPFPLP